MLLCALELEICIWYNFTHHPPTPVAGKGRQKPLSGEWLKILKINYQHDENILMESNDNSALSNTLLSFDTSFFRDRQRTFLTNVALPETDWSPTWTFFGSHYRTVCGNFDAVFDIHTDIADILTTNRINVKCMADSGSRLPFTYHEQSWQKLILLWTEEKNIYGDKITNFTLHQKQNAAIVR